MNQRTSQAEISQTQPSFDAVRGGTLSTLLILGAVAYAWQLHGWTIALSVAILLVSGIAIGWFAQRSRWKVAIGAAGTEQARWARRFRWLRGVMIVVAYAVLAVSAAERCDISGCSAILRPISPIVVFGVAWMVGGTAAVLTVQSAASGGRENSLVTATVWVALFLIGPVILLSMTLLSLWSFSRKGKLAEREEDLDKESALCRMIHLRRERDDELRSAPAPENWPMFHLWRTPEAGLLSAIEMYLWQIDGEREIPLPETPPSTIAGAAGLLSEPIREGMLDYARAAFALSHQQYLTLGDSLLEGASEVAAGWAVMDMISRRTQPAYPPEEWWQKCATWEEVRHGSLPPPHETLNLLQLEDENTRTGSDWRGIKAKATDGDMLYAFVSPPSSWRNLGGRGGLVLVRRGRPIGHVTMMMS